MLLVYSEARETLYKTIEIEKPETAINVPKDVYNIFLAASDSFGDSSEVTICGNLVVKAVELGVS